MKDKKEILLEVLYRHNKDYEKEKIDLVDYKEVAEIIYEAMEEWHQYCSNLGVKELKKEEL